MLQVRGDVSSQFLTGLLMALPLTGRTVRIEVVGELISKPYIEITLAMMARFGVKVEREGWQRFAVFGGQRYQSPGRDLCRGRCLVGFVFSRGRRHRRRAGARGRRGQDSVQGDVRFAEALAADGRAASPWATTGWRRVRRKPAS